MRLFDFQCPSCHVIREVCHNEGNTVTCMDCSVGMEKVHIKPANFKMSRVAPMNSDECGKSKQKPIVPLTSAVENVDGTVTVKSTDTKLGS